MRLKWRRESKTIREAKPIEILDNGYKYWLNIGKQPQK